MPGPFLVKKPGTFNVTSPGQYGDGKGSENPVPVGGANQIVLLLDIDDGGQSNNLEVFMEVSINGTDYYRQVYVPSGATPAVETKKYTFAAASFAVERLAVPLDVLAAYARFNFAVSAAGQWTNVACRAITGRV